MDTHESFKWYTSDQFDLMESSEEDDFAPKKSKTDANSNSANKRIIKSEKSTPASNLKHRSAIPDSNSKFKSRTLINEEQQIVYDEDDDENISRNSHGEKRSKLRGVKEVGTERADFFNYSKFDEAKMSNTGNRGQKTSREELDRETLMKKSRNEQSHFIEKQQRSATNAAKKILVDGQKLSQSCLLSTEEMSELFEQNPVIKKK